MSEDARRRPRRWTLRVVQVALALSALDIAVGTISTFWLGERTGSFWWLVMALPQVSIALLAVLICWAPDSRPQGLELNVGGLLILGLLSTLAFLKWPPAVIGALAILALFMRPQPGKFMSEEPPAVVGWRRR